MKNGFTLIELLAVIVILAIIALIAVPIILNIINNTKKESNKVSVENYLSALEQAIIIKNINGKFNPVECEIADNSLNCKGEFDKVNCKGEAECEEVSLEVKVNGEVPSKGIIYFENGSVTNGTNITIDDISFDKINSGLVIEQEEGPEHLAQKNVRVVTTPTTGIIPKVENENLKPGSEFQIKVNNTSGWLTFFVLSNEGDYVNLIAEQNIDIEGNFTSEPQDGDEWYITSSSSYDNRYGPVNAYSYISEATKDWVNVPIIKSFYYEDEGYKTNPTYGYQSIITEKDNEVGKYITTIIPFSSNYGNPSTYENLRVRLPKYSEITTNTSCIKYNGPHTEGACPLWMVNYLANSSSYTSSKKVNSVGSNDGYWLLDTHWGIYFFALHMYNTVIVDHGYTHISSYGIRPVITILKSDLLRVMK